MRPFHQFVSFSLIVTVKTLLNWKEKKNTQKTTKKKTQCTSRFKWNIDVFSVFLFPPMFEQKVCRIKKKNQIKSWVSLSSRVLLLCGNVARRCEPRRSVHFNEDGGESVALGEIKATGWRKRRCESGSVDSQGFGQGKNCSLSPLSAFSVYGSHVGPLSPGGHYPLVPLSQQPCMNLNFYL